MLSINEGKIELNGALGELIPEAAALIDAVASAVEKQAQDDKDSKLSYDFIIEAILAFLSKLHEFKDKDNIWGYEEEIEFLHKAKELRNRYHGKEGFIDYDSSNSVADDGDDFQATPTASGITGGASLGDFVIDHRMTDDDLFDIETLKNIKRKK
jgi:hypothetical protein